jgi:hypothetical protein
MIIDFMQTEGYTASAMTIQQESNNNVTKAQQRTSHIKRMKKALLGRIKVP